MKRLANRVLIFIVVLHTMSFIVGCSPKAQPKGWVSVEKPPMRVIVLDNEEDITPETIEMIIRYVGKQPYRDYRFNETTQIGVGFDVDVDHHTSDNKQIKIGD